MSTLNQFTQLYEIVKTLRSPEGCPWDREQTHDSIRSQLLEECYELIEAIDEKDDSLMREELGDVLLHLVFHSILAEERSAFTLEDVLKELCEKLIRRHPHVFDKENIDTTDGVLKKWDEIKKAEKPERTSVLSGIPKILPALMYAQEIQKKAAKVGFDWPEIQPVIEKVREEIDELEDEIKKNHPQSNNEALEDEMGDLFFALVNLSRHLKLNAEQVSRSASLKFQERFQYIEKEIREANKTFDDYSLEELEELWQQAKRSQ